MEKLAKDSIEIRNNYNLFPFRLSCDPKAGIIRMHNNDKKPITHITRRNVLLTDAHHWRFYNDRTGYYDKKIDKSAPFTGSYISKEESPALYRIWIMYMNSQYKHLRDTYGENSVESVIPTMEVEKENE